MKTRTFIAAALAIHARTTTTPRRLRIRRGWLWTGFLAIATMLFGPRPAQAAAVEAWVQRHSTTVSNLTDEAVKVVRDAAGDIIVTGVIGGWWISGDLSRAADLLTIKYSGADGSVLWQQRHKGPAEGTITTRGIALAVDGRGNVVVMGGLYDSEPPETYLARYAAADGALLWERSDPDILPAWPFPASLAVDGDGNVVVAGTTQGANSWSDFYTAKYAATDGALLWEKRYSGPGNSLDEAHAVAVDGNGNVVVAGNSGYDYYTAKYASVDGALLWERRFNGPGISSEEATAVAVDGSGNVVVTGTSYTVKYAAANGALLWERSQKAPANSYISATAVAVDGSGNVVNVVVTGTSFGTKEDYYTAKYAAADGALLWEKRYNGPASAYHTANELAVDGSGNVVVIGSSDNGTNLDCYTAKYAAADGALLWEKRYNGPANAIDYAKAVAVDGSGNVVVTGRTDAVISKATVGGDYYTAKYAAADGALLWEQRYDGSVPSAAYAPAAAVDASGNVVVTGNSNGNYYTARYAAADGALLWEKLYDGPDKGSDYASAMAVDGSGNFVVTGTSGAEHYTAKYAAADGGLLWESRYRGPGDFSSAGGALAVDSRGNVVVTGASNNGTNYDSYTAKYAAADGALLWLKRDDDSAHGLAFAGDVALDGSGNVVVTGTPWSSRNDNANYYDYYTAKYAAADGALLWERRYNDPANRDDIDTSVAVDDRGNVVVTGTSYGINSDRDYYTAKYAAADGALVWEQRYNGPGNGYDAASGNAVDGSGNVVVTGSSINGTTSDFYTAKYAAADGALLWEKRYNGPENGSDYANAIALDGRGNVVVTGSSWGTNNNVDYYTAKYAATDGSLLWEKRFRGPTSNDASIEALAVDGSGNVVVVGAAIGGFATVVYREVPEAVSIDLVPAGVRLRFTGVSDHSYNIERALAVTGPWSILNTQIAPASGAFVYVDTNPPAAAAFYRASEP